jgi:hypothetical protein
MVGIRAEIGRIQQELAVLRRQNISLHMRAADEANSYRQLEGRVPTREEVALIRTELSTVLERLEAAAGSGSSVD